MTDDLCFSGKRRMFEEITCFPRYLLTPWGNNFRKERLQKKNVGYMLQHLPSLKLLTPSPDKVTTSFFPGRPLKCPLERGCPSSCEQIKKHLLNVRLLSLYAASANEHLQWKIIAELLAWKYILKNLRMPLNFWCYKCY